MDHNIVEMAEAIVEESWEYDPHSLLSEEQQKQAQKLHIVELLQMKEHTACLQRAVRIIVQEGVQVMSRDETLLVKNTLKEVISLGKNAAVEADAECPQEVLNLSDEVMQLFLRVAQDQYRSQQWENAIDCFTLLTTLNPFVEEFWLGLGGSYQHLKQWGEARDTYATAVFLNKERPLTRLLVSECSIHCEDMEMAQQQLDYACELLQKRSWPEGWSHFADVLKKIIQQARR